MRRLLNLGRTCAVLNLGWPDGRQPAPTPLAAPCNTLTPPDKLDHEGKATTLSTLEI
jgi:hypothetical protein